MSDFPTEPPAPSAVKEDPSLLNSLGEGVQFDKDNNQFVFTVTNDDTQKKYQYSFVLRKWIPTKGNMQDEEKFEEEENKEGMRRRKRQKLEDIKLTKERLATRGGGVFITNLPDITENELVDIFKSYGQISIDKGMSPRVKLYYDSKEKFKHEALVLFENNKSIDLSIQMMNGTQLKDKTIKVERAKFDNKQQIEDVKNRFYSKIAIIENMFRKEELFSDKHLRKDIEDDVGEECERLGIPDLSRLSIFPNDGVVTLKFKSAKSANEVCKALNERYYDGLILKVSSYSGKKYT